MLLLIAKETRFKVTCVYISKIHTWISYVHTSKKRDKEEGRYLDGGKYLCREAE